MLFLYRMLINILILVSPIIILYRILKKKESLTRFKEKFSYFSKKRGEGKVLWFHGSSVGEILSIIPLLEKIEKNKSINKILVTSSTLSSSKVLSNLKFKKTIHQFYPIDSNFITSKFLNYWRPSIAIFVESEIWPNMIVNLKKKNIPLLLINARITKKTFSKWISIPKISNFLFKKFDLCLPQNLETKKFLKKLGAKKIKLIGNLKFSEAQKNKNNTLNKSLIKILKSKKIWCAASTHQGEEIICAQAHKKINKNYKNLMTIIIPRHIQRTEQIMDDLKKFNLKIHLHSSNKKIQKNTDIYLVDTYGETNSFYKFCETVFLGGSMIKHGGQNPLEPLRFGCNILHGPNVSNFYEVYKLLDKEKLSHKVKHINDLVSSLNLSFKSKKNLNNNIKKIKQLGNNILSKTLIELNHLI